MMNDIENKTKITISNMWRQSSNMIKKSSENVAFPYPSSKLGPGSEYLVLNVNN